MPWKALQVSHFIPVFSFAADPAQIPAELHPDPVLKLCPDQPWTATSRNWWFQGLLEEALAAQALRVGKEWPV